MSYSTDKPVKKADKDEIKARRIAAMAGSPVKLEPPEKPTDDTKDIMNMPADVKEKSDKPTAGDTKPKKETAPDSQPTTDKIKNVASEKKNSKAGNDKNTKSRVDPKDAGPAPGKTQSCIRLRGRTDMALRLYAAQSPYNMSQIADIAIEEYLKSENPEIFTYVDKFMNNK